jgi:hypothetical protein
MMDGYGRIGSTVQHSIGALMGICTLAVVSCCMVSCLSRPSPEEVAVETTLSASGNHRVSMATRLSAAAGLLANGGISPSRTLPGSPQRITSRIVSSRSRTPTDMVA